MAAPRRCVELANPCSGLNKHSAEARRLLITNRDEVGGGAKRQIGTVGALMGIDARWNSPFVAQVLGQDPLTNKPDPERGTRAYALAASTRAQRLLGCA